MDTSTLIMLICLGLGCALALTSLVFALTHGLKVIRKTRAFRAALQPQAAAIIRQAQLVCRRLEEVQASQAAAAERLQALSAAAAQLTLLKDELDRSSGWLWRAKP